MSNKKSPAPQPAPKSPPPASGKAKPDNARDFDDPVNEASDESFPASDPPAWTDTTATKDGS